MKKLGALLLVASLVVLTPTAASAKERHAYVVGDSISYRMSHSALRPKGWTWDAFPGRRITALTQPLLSPTADYWPAVTHMFDIKPRHRVSAVVIALGTNGADTYLTVDQAKAIYLRGISELRRRNIWRRGPKRIVLVTPYRVPGIEQGHIDPATGKEYAPYQWASREAVYAKAIRQLARERAHVCLMNWRAQVKPSMLLDGIHPNTKGRRLWRNLALKAVDNCR